VPAEAYLQAHAPSWKLRYARATWLNPIKAYAYPIIGDLALEAIELSHVVAVMDAAEEAGAKETARRVRARIERVLTAAMAKGRCDTARRNPADAKLIAATRPTRRSPGTRPHYRAVKVDGAPEVFRALACQDGSAFSSWVFMIATAARPSEALGARWQEVDFDRRLWTLPAARMKSAREHVVPLSTAALAVLKRQACVRTGDAIFPGRRGRRSLTTASPRHRPRPGSTLHVRVAGEVFSAIGPATSVRFPAISPRRRWRIVSAQPKAPIAD
jgi:integrase